MPDPNDPIAALREALAATPQNIPLRKHIAELCIKRGLFAEAEELYRDGLRHTPESEVLKLGLATSFQRQGRHNEALVLVEDLLKRPDAPAGAHVLHARLLLRTGSVEQAERAYRRAVQQDASLADDDLAEAVGYRDLVVDEDDIPWDDDDDVDDMGRIRMRAGGGEGDPSVEMERPKINFDDVGGMDAVKEQVRLKIIEPLKHPEMYKAYGVPVGGGILLYGPPGCGKTHLARATAGQVEARFMSVGIHDVLDMWFGNSEQKLHAMFDQARRHTPCVLFFDEVDAIGASRTDMRNTGGRHLINQFLSELDGVGSGNDGLLILAATNAPWHMDPAFRRPGRFDRIIFVPPPDEPARAGIMRVLLKGKPQADIDCEAIAKKTAGFSGADLKSVIDHAVEDKLRDAMKTGLPTPLTTKDLLRGAKRVKPSTREWFATARNYALYSNESGQYDEILEYLKMK